MTHCEKILVLAGFPDFVNDNFKRISGSDRLWYSDTISYSSYQVAKYYLRILNERDQRALTLLKSDDMKAYLMAERCQEIERTKLFNKLGLPLKN